MNSTIFSITGAGAIVIAGAIFTGTTAFAQGATVSDAQVEANVLRALAGAPQLATQQIKTTTVYGTVTLSGSVSDESTRVLAEDLASRAQGVQKVVDELTLTSDPNPNPPAGQPQPYPQPADTQQNQGSNPTLQSDGTVAPPEAAQNGQQPQGAPEPGFQSPPAPPDNGQYGNNAPPPQGQPQGQNGAPAYRQPYRGGQPSAYSQQPPPQYGAQEGGREVTIPSGALVRMRLSEGLIAKLIKPGTAFDGTVLNDVIADGEVAIPRGATVQGTIVQANASGAVGGKGQLALQLNSVSLSGRNYPIVSDTWTHYGRDKTGQTVGSAVGLGGFGALIGALAGGGAGAAIGAAAGVGAGIGASAASGRNDVVVPAEAIISFHLVQPAHVVTVSQQEMDRLGYGVQQANLQRRPVPQPAYGRPGYYPAPY
jgi:BON domain